MKFSRALVIMVAACGGLAATAGSASAQTRQQGWVCTNLAFTNQGPRCLSWRQSPLGLLMPPPFYATAPSKKPMAGAGAEKPKKVIKKKRKRGRR
jgi:hypothetical protein